MGWFTSRLSWMVGGAALLIALVVGGYCFHRSHVLPKQEAKLETTLAVDTALYARDTLHTDQVLVQDSAKPTTVKAVKVERKSAAKALGTSQKQVKNLKNQLQAGRVTVFGEGNYEFPSQGALAKGSLYIKAGVAVRIAPGTWVQGYVNQPITGSGQRTYNVGVRKEIKLF